MLWSNISYCRATLLLILSCLVVLVQAQESTSQAQGTIKVGILHSVTGTMAISEAALRDTMLMLIEEQNAKGGVLGKQLEPIVYNPRSNWPLYAQQARQMIELNEVAVIFGCWTSASRKAVLPVVEELDNLLFYPVQYEGQESSKNIIYTGATPNQQALPAVDYLREYRGIERWILVGTDYVYPRATNRALVSYLTALGVAQQDILLHYTGFGFQDWRDPITRFMKYAAQGKRTAILSTVNGDANIGFYHELQAMGVSSEELPVLAFSVGEQELLSIGSTGLAGHLAAWNYFMAVETPANEAFIGRWRNYTGNTSAVTNDPMEAHLLGFQLWLGAVAAAGTTEPAMVRRKITGLQVESLGGARVTVQNNNHIDKQVIIAEISESGELHPIWESPATILPLPWLNYGDAANKGAQ